MPASVKRGVKIAALLLKRTCFLPHLSEYDYRGSGRLAECLVCSVSVSVCAWVCVCVFAMLVGDTFA